MPQVALQRVGRLPDRCLVRWRLSNGLTSVHEVTLWC